MPKHPEPTEELVTAFAVAERFGVAVSTVRRWVREGRIPYTRVSRRTVRFRIKEIEAATSNGACRVGADNNLDGATLGLTA